ncbi:MAG TPA: sulfatase, partial [Acidobacteriota bacterium]|nr:sulfatase [Acidobacteriota bacterium]
DALRADHLGAYGYPLDQKNLSTFAKDSLVYENAFTTLPTTQPAISSIFTSMYPRAHTVRKNGLVLPDEALTLAEILKKNGWKTAAFVSAFPLDRRFKLDQGFDDYKDSIGQNGPQKGFKFEVPGDRMTNAVLRYLKKHPVSEKQFLWIHYFDPHAPYKPPKRFNSVKSPLPNASAALSAYDGEIQFLDEQVGILIDQLKKRGIWKNTLVILVSDHGEGFGEHGYTGHGWFLYDEVIRVALMMHGPGIKPGRSSFLIQHVDLAPGILDYFGIPVPGTFEGKSWWNVLQGKLAPRDAVWVERRLPPIATGPELAADEETHPGAEEKWTYRTATAKFIWSSDGKYEYYDLTKDPLEKNNLYTPGNAQAAELEKQGIALRDRAQRLALKPGRDLQQQDEESREGLKALGYIN